MDVEAPAVQEWNDGQVAAAESELLYQNCEAEGDALVLTSRRTAHYGHHRPLEIRPGFPSLDRL